MSTLLSKEVRKVSEKALEKGKLSKNLHRVEFEGNIYPLLVLRDNGYSVVAEGALNMSGLIDIFDWLKHLSRCLIIASDEEKRGA